jgi:prepilin-type N-terminal cleavage/methylation domain-containing protein
MAIQHLKSTAGFTLTELLVALLLSSLVGAAALEFYLTQHNNMVTQENVSDMQQNLRASMDDIIHQTKNAGANLPTGIPAFVSGNSNPDTLELNYARIGGSVQVAEHTPKGKANPLHISVGTDVTEFNVGDFVFLWHKGTGKLEQFPITGIDLNVGGWLQIRHDQTDFGSEPLPGDLVTKLNSIKYFVDGADPKHPALVKSVNDAAPQVFADNIDDFQVRYVRSKLDTVDALGPNDTAFVVMVSLSALTEDNDFEGSNHGGQARRHRSLNSAVVVRNNRF